jgi:Protein of unknwon function (DUF3310).
MAVANEPQKFKVKNDVTVYSLLPPFMDTHTVVWNDENGHHQETECSIGYVKDQFRNDIWTYIIESPKSSVDKPQSALDKQVSGNHYKDFKIQPAEYCHANNIPFLEGNVIKYTSRHRAKNKKKDLEKAIHCLELLIELEYGNED